MDIKNFLGNFSDGSGKIKIAIFGVFVLMVAVFFAFGGLDWNYIASANLSCSQATLESRSCGVNGEVESLAGNVYRCGNSTSGGWAWFEDKYNRCTSGQKCCVISGNATCVDANYNCGGASSSSSASAQQNQDLSFLTSAQNVADGGACPCGLTHTGICSANAPSVNGGYCKNGNCVSGKCKLLECAISDSDGKVIARIGEGVKTCTKPSILSGNGVYVCGQSPQKSQDLYSSDGSLSSEKEPFSGTIVYNLSSEETCYSGCSNGKCNNEAKCKTLAQIIQGQFSRYQSKVKDCKERWEGSTDEDKGYKCYQCYREAKESIINALADFGEKEKIFEAFGKLAYPNGLNCVDRSLVISNKSLTDSPVQNIVADDILCARTDTGTGGMTMNTACGKISATGIQKNKICVGEEAEKSLFLRGKSFDCKMANGCGFAGWILGDSPEKCNPGETNAFTLSDYFSKSGAKNGDGVPVMGWGKGADRYGCEYVAYSQFAKVSDTDKSKNLYTYVQIPTGDCHKSGAGISPASDFSCADYELPKSGGTTAGECPEINFSGECSGGSPMFTVKEQGQGGLLPQQYKECGKNAIEFILGKEVSEDCGESFKAKCLAAFQNCSGSASTVECVSDNDCQKKFGSDYYCIYKGLSATVGFCSNEGGCFSSSNGNKNFQIGAVVCGGNGTSQYCKTLKNPPSSTGWEITPGGDCVKNGGTCNKDTGLCEGGRTADCSNTPKSCLTGANDCGDCGAGWTCKSRSEVINATDYESLGLNATKAQIEAASGGDGICVKGTGSGTEETGECDFRINAGGTCSTSNTKCRNGVYVPFTITEISGNCDDLSCTVTNDFDNTSVDAAKASAGWWACSYPQSKSSGGDSEGTKGSDPSKLKFTIACDGKKATMTCPFPTADNNKFCEEEEEAQEEKKAEEGEKCKKDEDCGEGLVCLDGKCVTEEDAEEKEEQEKQDKTAPKVTISSPSGTINTKTAELSVSTDIEAECKYMLSRDGSFNDFSGGMFMGGGGGTSHTATLSNLTGIPAADCKYNHTVKVMCKNSKASQDAKSAVGSAQNNFSVDLSQDSANAPAVSAAPMEAKYTVANPVLKVTTDRPADCEYKKDGDFTFGAGTKFDTTGNYVHNTQLNGLPAGDHTYYVVCKDKETCAVSKPGLPVKFAVDLSEDPANAPAIANTTPETQTVANPTLSVSTDRPATCQYKKDATFAYGAGTQFANDGEYAHSVVLTDLPDGKYTFYVACKDKATGAAKTLENPIITTLDRGQGKPNIVSTTPGTQTVTNPALSVTTDIPSACQYKEGAAFSYGSGTSMDSADGYSHTVSLAGVSDGTHTYYVACKNKDSSATAALETPIATTITRSGAIPTISNTTPNNQTVISPIISITTAAAANCQYNKDSDFTYGQGTPFSATGGTNHSVTLPNMANGTYTYYVSCKDAAGGQANASGTQIIFTVNTSANAPVISNTTPASQSTSNPTLSVLTDRAATCQYNKDADFAYGAGTQFTIDGGTGHSAVLSNVADGTHTYYVVCADSATQASNSPGAQIVFSVSTAAAVCADISSNDKQSDIDRDYGDDADYDSTYVWRSSPAGVVEMFEKVDWYAGYQFTPEKNGNIAELCGYFDSGSRNRVSLYDGAYKEIAGVEIDGQGGWSCAGISPAAVKADRRYYVIARVQDDAIYFAYDSGMLPRDTEGAVVESGVRQMASAGDFGESLKKYDYMVFGLVDAKIRFVDENSQGPEISSPLPSGDRNEGDAVLSVQTDEDAACKFDRQDAKYGEMKYDFGATGQKLHQQKVCDLSEGEFTWYVRCEGKSGANNGSALIRFKVDD